MSVEFLISNKYLRSNRKKGFVSFISGVSMVGLILAVMSLITVLSVMNGFHEEITNRVLNTISHSYITESDDTLEDWVELRKKINSQEHIVASSPYVEDFALMTSKNASQGVSVRGILVDLESTTSSLLNDIKYGDLSLNEDDSSILIGVGLATIMGTGIGDQLTLIAPTRNSLGLLVPISTTFTVGGIFNAGLNEYNNGLAFIHLYDAQDLFTLGNEVTGIRLKVDDLFKANIITQETVKSLGDGFYGVDWMQQKQNFMRALNLEKQMIAIILSLIIAVAAFNIVSMMVMVVTDKKTDIAILRTLGMTPKRIVRIFFYQGLSIGFIGILVGTVLGLLLALNIESVISGIETIIGFQFFPKDVFYINRFPSKILMSDVASIMIGAFILVIIAAIYPARRAGKVNISEVLRHE
ncbi:lipoprotein-releasing ABC transporter permease subunit [Candidatus Thioglobus sp. NP1]|uniref:lipoprotein-releasing ABC transporter permease subunit n=1 Tax=Candidatus Thioglobus sp. NP1 TaxID=2508687 RepID=UPI000DED528A|nr:lipoprotein-releasing ABC transporter permease subunit [Candidatus Thioglobus sp. NP1]AXE61765.1 lipoprotein-releasing system transmembrane subunit LolC [Candidatus Thioglobus sp. NP1]